MTRVIKKYYEAFLLVIVLLCFVLFRNEVFDSNTYLIAAAAIALYFVPLRIAFNIFNSEIEHRGVQVISSIIIAAIIGVSLLAVNDKNYSGLSTMLYGLAIINVGFMIYALIKDEQRNPFLLHLIMILLISALLNFV
ncbi:hypothetical protein GCM10007424_26930 [Flavobacterium suaedae]|uniref:Uncharacterized protein n=1 Tax=Flavobacterium suaedae TaxID=1767027 RepID=A0ABQ1K6W1_9FLAO|nr:hypothetical protein [Flavobacterium suaedae]GGB85490.1 hypothetical protein GCM10007424_26930 [Flavobacterium suaedae]